MPAMTPVAPGIVRPPARPARPARHRTGFWLVGFVFLVTMAFSAVPAPLYVLYAARDRFGPLMITVIFAAYAVGVIASLFLAGYAGLAVPVVALGLATQLLSGRVAVLGFAVLLVAVVALVSRRLLRTRAGGRGAPVPAH